jgi:hypothetical protein
VSLLEVQENAIQATTNQIAKLTDYLEDKFFWPETLSEMRTVLTKVEDAQTQPGRPVGVWIEKFGKNRRAMTRWRFTGRIRN